MVCDEEPGLATQRMKVARYGDVEALVKAAELPPKQSPGIEVRLHCQSDRALLTCFSA